MQKSTSPSGSLTLAGAQSASNRTPRQINRNLIFHLIRLGQPLSRAELARRSGLRRSTVSLIVDELLAEKWLFEGEIGRLPRGRRPTMLQLSDARGVLALDIHPLSTTIAIADLAGRIISQEVIPLPLDSAQALATITTCIHGLTTAHSERTFSGAGIALPGRTDPALETLVFSPRLQWPAINLRQHIEQATGLPVEIDNVANACALAEVWFGTSDANDGVIVVNVSEGIAVGIFVNGRILRGHRGMAGEFGHVQVQPDGELCACGNYGCWETLTSNAFAVRHHGELQPADPARDYDDLLARVAAEEPAAVEVLTRVGVELGRGIRLLLSGLAPREIVVVGDIARVWRLVGPLVESEMRQGFLTQLPLVRCTGDGNEARLRGAVALILSKAVV